MPDEDAYRLIAVADTSPLNYVVRIGHVDILRLVPAGVGKRRDTADSRIERSVQDWEGAAAYAVLIDHRYRVLEVQLGTLAEDAVQERQHLGVRVRAAAEEDHSRAACLEKGEEAWVVEV